MAVMVRGCQGVAPPDRSAHSRDRRCATATDESRACARQVLGRHWQAATSGRGRIMPEPNKTWNITVFT